MWLTEEYNNFWEQGILVTEKLDETNGAEVYLNEKLGNVLALDGQLKFCEKDAPAIFEMLSHVPLCAHPTANKVLVLGGGSGGIATELLKHEDINCIDLVDEDDSIKELSKKYFSKFSKSFESEKVFFHEEKAFSFLQKAQDKDYDVIILQRGLELDDLSLAQIKRILKGDGIFVMGSKNWWIEPEEMKEQLTTLHEKFNILMPYRFESYSHAGFGGSILFASNKYHPTADIILQKSDLLDDLDYYSCDVHLASFSLPAKMRRDLYPVMKV